MSDDAKKPELWDIPNFFSDSDESWDERLNGETQAIENFKRAQEDLVGNRQKVPASLVPYYGLLLMLEYTRRNRLLVFMLVRAMISAQHRISSLEYKLAEATGQPPPPAPEPEDDLLLKWYKATLEGVTRGGLKSVLPDLPD